MKKIFEREEAGLFFGAGGPSFRENSQKEKEKEEKKEEKGEKGKEREKMDPREII
jgi:hypothetical protein